MAPVGPNPEGFYLDCDPATGRAGTVYRAEEFNELILNLRELLRAASVAGTKGSATMLRAALHRLYAGSGRVIAATGTLTPDDAGLLVIDATTANVTLTLPPAAALPSGHTMVQCVRQDTAQTDVRLIPAAGDAIRGGIFYLDAKQWVILRSDGVATWYVLSASATILRSRTLQVAPGGVAAPSDPLGGTPFNSLASALDYLTPWRIAGGTVTINVAAGTYNATVPINFTHVDGVNIRVVGAGAATTILRFPGGSAAIFGGLNFGGVTGVTFEGDQTGTAIIGVDVARGSTTLTNVVIQKFSGVGLQLRGQVQVFISGTLTVQQNGAEGVFLFPSAYLTGATLATAQNAGLANLYALQGSIVLTTFTNDGGQRALYLTGSAAFAQITTLTSHNATVKAEAVRVLAGAVLQAVQSQPNTWLVDTPGTSFDVFRAERYGAIFSESSMQSGNRSTTSPAINTLGNTQSYIMAI
ncbi:MAG TPA: hypothetical protein VKB54_20070 [Solirubrobacteraceae bacterium]|nr:hypothetical protein [Solirubrobacteraceae bacterium]